MINNHEYPVYTNNCSTQEPLNKDKSLNSKIQNKLFSIRKFKNNQDVRGESIIIDSIEKFAVYLNNELKENNFTDLYNSKMEEGVTKEAVIKAIKNKTPAFIFGETDEKGRSKENIINRCFVALDIDQIDSSHTKEQLEKRIKSSLNIIFANNFTYFVYSTASHTLERPKIRVLIPTDRPTTLEEYPIIVKNLVKDSCELEFISKDTVITNDTLGVDKGSCEYTKLMYAPCIPYTEYQAVFIQNITRELLIVDNFLTPIDEELKKVNETSDIEVVANHLPLPDVTTERVKEVLDKYDCNKTTYPEWFEVCQALHHQFKGNEEGLEIFTNWSLTDSRYHDEKIKRECKEKYYSIRGQTSNPKTFATIIKLVKDKKNFNDQSNYCNDPKYDLREDGVYCEIQIKNEKNSFWAKLCDYLKPVGVIRDVDKKNWAKVCYFTNKDNVKSEIFVNDEDLTDPTALLKLFLNNGLKVPEVNEIYKGKQTNKLLAQYINSCNPSKRFIGVDKVGWHGDAYIMPFVDNPRNVYSIKNTEQSETKEREEYILKINTSNQRKLIRQGTIEEWQNNIGKLASGNNLLMFSIATALAAPLFSIFGEEGCCFHFSGSSSIGKTTALYVASSVWGMGKPSSFRTTDNAAESLCKNSNDGLLLMDELAEIDPNSLEKITYLFGNGTGKGRAKKSGEAQTITTFKILGLSTGEIGLQAKLNEKGKNTTAGQSVRFIEIPADSGKGLGIFDTLHHFASGRDLSDYLRKERHDCGVVIDKWMQYVSSNFNDLKKAITVANKTWFEKYLPPNSDPQVQRVGKKFALIATIGETAIDAGILPFAQGDISEACKVLFERWLEQRGNNGSHEMQGIIERLKMLTQEGINSRFLDADEGCYDNKNIQKIAGYKKLTKIKDSETEEDTTVIKEFYISIDVFRKEILENRSPKIFCKQLIENGYLSRDNEGNYTKPVNIRGFEKTRRFYVVPADKFNE